MSARTQALTSRAAVSNFNYFHWQSAIIYHTIRYMISSGFVKSFTDELTVRLC